MLFVVDIAAVDGSLAKFVFVGFLVREKKFKLDKRENRGHRHHVHCRCER